MRRSGFILRVSSGHGTTSWARLQQRLPITFEGSLPPLRRANYPVTAWLARKEHDKILQKTYWNEVAIVFARVVQCLAAS
jgi:hypothetical protein